MDTSMYNTYMTEPWNSFVAFISSLLRESFFTGSRLSTNFHPPRDGEGQKRGRTDKVFLLRLIYRKANSCSRYPLVSRFEQVNFTPRRLLTDGSWIREDFRDFSITSLETASRSPRCPLPIGFRSSR